MTTFAVIRVNCVHIICAFWNAVIATALQFHSVAVHVFPTYAPNIFFPLGANEATCTSVINF